MSKKLPLKSMSVSRCAHWATQKSSARSSTLRHMLPACVPRTHSNFKAGKFRENPSVYPYSCGSCHAERLRRQSSHPVISYLTTDLITIINILEFHIAVELHRDGCICAGPEMQPP